MQLLSDDEVVKIDLDDDTWVTVYVNKPYLEVQPIIIRFDPHDNSKNLEPAFDLLRKVLAGWSIKKPCTTENIDKLTNEAVLTMIGDVIQTVMPQKKSSTNSKDKDSE